MSQKRRMRRRQEAKQHRLKLPKNAISIVVAPFGEPDFHDDCPICQAMRESGEPIYRLDDILLDDDFAATDEALN